jgi:hypothetical protein
MIASNLTIEDVAKLREKGRHFLVKDNGVIVNFAGSPDSPNWIWVQSQWDRFTLGPVTLEQAKNACLDQLEYQISRIKATQPEDFNNFEVVDTKPLDAIKARTKSKKARRTTAKVKLPTKGNSRSARKSK